MQNYSVTYNNPDDTRDQLRSLLESDQIDDDTRQHIEDAIVTITQMKSDLRRAGWSFQDRQDSK